MIIPLLPQDREEIESPLSSKDYFLILSYLLSPMARLATKEKLTDKQLKRFKTIRNLYLKISRILETLL